MEDQKVIHWGIIGLGKIARKFAQDLRHVPNSKLVAVASTSLERAQQFASDFDVPEAFGTYEGLFEAKKIDAVYIATPHATHATCTLLSLAHGVPVLCEKPLALNGEEVAQMVETARTKEVFLMEAMWTRFLPATRYMLDIVQAGKIGKIKSIHADFGFVAPFVPDRRAFNKELGGGSLLDIGIYPAYLAYLLLGMPAKIQATSTWSSTGVDESTSMLFSYNGGEVAVLHSSFVTRTKTEAMIYGEKGSIQMHERFHETKQVSVFDQQGELVETQRFERESFGYNYEIEAVNENIRANEKENAWMRLDDSVALMKILDEVRRVAV